VQNKNMLIHVARDHLQKAATLEQLVPILILIWEKSETTADGEKKRSIVATSMQKMARSAI
jgi:hypothetical protein